MAGKFFTLFVSSTLFISVGCSMCSDPFDYTYAAFGGKWQRADPYSGRVGSLFHPAEGVAADAAYQRELQDPASQPTEEQEDAANTVQIWGDSPIESDHESVAEIHDDPAPEIIFVE